MRVVVFMPVGACVRVRERIRVCASASVCKVWREGGREGEMYVRTQI